MKRNQERIGKESKRNQKIDRQRNLGKFWQHVKKLEINDATVRNQAHTRNKFLTLPYNVCLFDWRLSALPASPCMTHRLFMSSLGSILTV